MEVTTVFLQFTGAILVSGGTLKFVSRRGDTSLYIFLTTLGRKLSKPGICIKLIHQSSLEHRQSAPSKIALPLASSWEEFDHFRPSNIVSFWIIVKVQISVNVLQTTDFLWNWLPSVIKTGTFFVIFLTKEVPPPFSCQVWQSSPKFSLFS